jgi:hypothetical protein
MDQWFALRFLWPLFCDASPDIFLYFRYNIDLEKINLTNKVLWLPGAYATFI